MTAPDAVQDDDQTTRRQFLKCGLTVAVGSSLALRSASTVLDEQKRSLPRSSGAARIADGVVTDLRGRRPLSKRPKAADHSLVAISGSPREQGQAYGRMFADDIHQFLEQHIYKAFNSKTVTRKRMLDYAGACLKPIRQLSPQLAERYAGMAEGSGLRLEEQVLITLHEELWHGGIIPGREHCTAVAVGPPDTNDGKAYVCQSWDWYGDLYGKSQMIRWRNRAEPSVISYSYPGLWVAAGINSAGIALTWTSVWTGAAAVKPPRPAVGVPTYALISRLLEQRSLEAVVKEAKRVQVAGWFTFVLADGKGNLMNIEGSPKQLVVQRRRGSMTRVSYGTRQLTQTHLGQEIEVHPQCRRMRSLIGGMTGKINRQVLENFYGDHQSTICKHFGSLDVMIFDTVSRTAYVTRGPGCLKRYRPFGFSS